MPISSEIYYYEHYQGGFLLFVDGDAVFCNTFSEMADYVDSPDTAEFTEVGQYNWQALFESGAFNE